MIDCLADGHSIPSKVIYFEDILSAPEETIKSLVHFLNIGDVDITEAIDNVDER